ncbi:hypothetical protein POMI540_4161 [Schizosaccharomyces pombe]|uniref:Cytochrome c oxidase assembly factor 2 n=1 Tax=Schizosaccharomyces pombe (strain 972 / ATCC 24843) TaxID=284812 RepID=COA2_SCHPO|nr:putative cytochrome C oxidase assembly factor Coa2 [Schizosaccharomyces pombe]G2TRM8.1 RecName: Full=Cytochrome c oxidase assembly factor 2 [Schizosaccharomyces pombe 972h-]CCD31330.1 cytochrome C oxidase assembly factor Coa2 (predicted) [Schizosaccharomyces pombe]|eukprot:NP_001343120.1 putative cytochrome C oxidase assembly factor Coa2 [Schizosaccharomyces pombe]
MFRTLKASQKRSLVNLMFGTTALFATATVIFPSLLPCPAMKNPYLDTQSDPGYEELPENSRVIVIDQQSPKSSLVASKQNNPPSKS